MAIALGMASAAALSAGSAAWLDAGRPSGQARQALELLAGAADHGLNPNDYHAGTLRVAVSEANTAALPSPEQLATLERALTSAMERFLGDLHRGRIDPRQIHQNFSVVRSDGFDAALVLQETLASGRLADAVRDAAPTLPLYARLRDALARYRALGDHAAWRWPLPALPRSRRDLHATLAPGDAYDGLAPLAARLQALGDLAGDAPVPARYDGPLVRAVASFQQRHGLTPDGVLGAATLLRLQVPPAARVRQIELALERLRWTPLMRSPRMIVINIPEFALRAYEVRDGRIHVVETMKVIVGKAMDTRTPMFDEEMRFIEFSPYWNVPPSIARGETVPRLRRDPAYFRQQGFEFVGADGRVSDTLSPAQLDAVLAGHARIRQRPGPQNALGDIKFVFPNRDNIYLHHTPSTQLFGRDRRDLSHGCIRVENPVALAKFVLQGQSDWTEQRIRHAMEWGESSTLRLSQPIPVLIAYGTALVKDGRLHFFDDIYGHDRVLEAALQRRTASLAPHLRHIPP